jgi:Mce-associated membrane protein
MEVAAGGSGGGDALKRARLNVALYVVVMVAAALLVVAAVRVLDDSGPTSLPVKGVAELDEAPATEQERYADILASASKEATAFLNIRYDTAQESIDAVMAGATGDFRDQYAQATEALITLLQDNKSIRTGEVIWAGVVAQDPDSATVILATTGTVQNNQTGANPKAENYRIQMDLVAEKGRWLTSDLQFVP